MLEELLYCSVSVPSQLTNVDLDHILASARRRNVAENITGVLRLSINCIKTQFHIAALANGVWGL